MRTRGLKGHRKGLKRHKTTPLSAPGQEKMSSYSLIAPLTLLPIPFFPHAFPHFLPPLPPPLSSVFLSSTRIFSRDGKFLATVVFSKAKSGGGGERRKTKGIFLEIYNIVESAIVDFEEISYSNVAIITSK